MAVEPARRGAALACPGADLVGRPDRRCRSAAPAPADDGGDRRAGERDAGPRDAAGAHDRRGRAGTGTGARAGTGTGARAGTGTGTGTGTGACAGTHAYTVGGSGRP